MLGKLKSDFRFPLRTDLFFLLIDACYHHASYKIASTVYDTMVRYDVAPDNRIKLMQFNQRKEDIKQQQKRPLDQTQKS